MIGAQQFNLINTSNWKRETFILFHWKLTFN